MWVWGGFLSHPPSIAGSPAPHPMSNVRCRVVLLSFQNPCIAVKNYSKRTHPLLEQKVLMTRRAFCKDVRGITLFLMASSGDQRDLGSS